MAKFVYRMENILSVKRKLEDQAKHAFAEASLALRMEEERLDMLQGRKDGYERQLSGEVRGSLQIQEIRRIQDAIEVMKYHIRMQVIAVNVARQRLERERENLTQAMIERKAQEKLKERAFEEFLQEVGREERREIDELVSFQHHVTDSEEDGHGEEEEECG